VNDRDALTRAVLLHPAEDAPKVALADWYEEHGTPEERVRAEWMRRPELDPTVMRRGRTRAARACFDYAANLLAGLVPKTWAVWPIVCDRQHPVGDEAERGENPNSWPYATGDCSFSSSRPYFVVGIRHGFITRVAAPTSRLSKVLPAVVARQPVCEVGNTQHFFEFLSFVTHMPWGEDGRDQRCIRLLANRIPKAVWVRLTPETWQCRPFIRGALPDTARTYPNLTAAYEDLSRAWVNWARSKAGLPELP